MPSFSQRYGYTPFEKQIQRETINEELRNGLWSLLQIYVWDLWGTRDVMGRRPPKSADVEDLVVNLWFHHFRRPTDTIGYFPTALGEIRNQFFNCKWNEVYDFVEFILRASAEFVSRSIVDGINGCLERENAAYRVVDNRIVEITDEHEITSIEESLSQGPPEAAAHIQSALSLLSDRNQPDYRNSIKEAISAVEAVCRQLTGNAKATLGSCLKTLRPTGVMHPSLESALSKLYGFTSDSGGIRHAMTENDFAPSYADAKFMLVACTSFCNYLVTKSAESD